ncbi:unnamed protein product [Peniophora sp. CBMAI 1063]|nr:unnamed protein product [Peniophora sp. CBMAI 1063]
MPDETSPQEVLKDELFLLRLGHIVFGIILWDLVSNMEYEWSVWKGERRYLWTIWLHAACRLMLLAWVALSFAVEITQPDCTELKALTLTVSVVSYMILACASLMIALRAVAIWQRKKIIMLIAYGMLVACVAVRMKYLFSLAVGGAFSSVGGSAQSSGCPQSSVGQLVNTSTLFATDFLLIMIMMVGLIRMEEARRFGITRHLYNSGLLWMILVMVIEIPNLVLAALDLNGPLDDLLGPFEVAALAICATHMYRDLAAYTHVIESLNVPVTTATMCFETATGVRLDNSVPEPTQS